MYLNGMLSFSTARREKLSWLTNQSFDDLSKRALTKACLIWRAERYLSAQTRARHHSDH